MKKQLLYLITAFALSAVLFSCSGPRILLKETARFDTLNIQLDVKLIQDYEYRLALEQKMEKYVTVYNKEEHPFKLSFNKDRQTANCKVEFIRVKFINKKQSNMAAAVSAVGIGTAAYLIASKFFIPFGWFYIPNAKSTIRPHLSTDISNLESFPAVTVASTGMYRKKEKQIELQSTKVVKYIVSMIQNLEKEYQQNQKK